MCEISIIVPVYNVEQYIDECILSILNQTFSDFELILIDDASTDGSLKLMNVYKRKDKRIKIITSKVNEGLGLTRNKGIKCAKGKYIMFIDSDDYIETNYVSLMIKSIKNANADFCVTPGFYLKSQNNINKLFYIDKRIQNTVIDNPIEIKNNTYGLANTCSGCLFVTEIIKNNNLFFISEREFLSEDLIYLIHYFQYCTKLFITDYLGYYYRYNPNSLSRKYNPNRFSILRNTVTIMSDLYKKYGIINSNIRISNYYWGVYEKCVNQIIRNNNFSPFEKIKELKRINDGVSKRYLNTILHNTKGLHHVLCYLLLNDYYYSVYILLTLYNVVFHHTD